MTLLQNGRRYFDWNASALLCENSRRSLLSNLDLIGNASSVHFEGRKARNIIERSRDDVMDLLGLDKGTISLHPARRNLRRCFYIIKDWNVQLLNTIV